MDALLNLGCGNRHHPAWVNLDVAAHHPRVIRHDLRQGIPYPDATFDAVYHSHVLEHMPRAAAPAFLAECLRVLKPGGVLRVVVPDLENIARTYLQTLDEARAGLPGAEDRHDWMLVELLDQLVRHEPGGEMLRHWWRQPMPAEDFVLLRHGSEVRDALQAIRNSPHPPPAPQEAEPLAVGAFRLSGEAHLWMYDSHSLERLLREAGFAAVAARGALESAIPGFAAYHLDTEADGRVRKPDSLILEAVRPVRAALGGGVAWSGRKARRRPKVVHVCMQDHCGAGTAAVRLHQGLLDLGVDSHFYAFHRSTTLENVHLIPAPQGESQYVDPGQPPVFRSTALERAFAWWQAMVTPYPRRSPHIECFSDTSSLADMTAWEHLADADVVNLHWVAGTVDLPRQHAVLRGKPVVWTLHDMNPFTGGCHYSAGCGRYAQGCGACPMLGSSDPDDLSRRILERKAQAYAALDITCVTPGAWLGDCARAGILGGKALRVVPNGERLDVFKPMDRAAIRHQLGIDPQAFVLAFCAANVANPRKGGAQLIKALESLARLHPGCRPELVVMGGGTMELPAGFTVHTSGYVHDEAQLALLYAMADAFLLPSLEDNLPNVMLESLACGTPVVGFRVGGIPDAVEHRKTGWLADAGHAEGLMQGILWASALGARAGAIRTACRARAEADYSLRLQAGRYLELYGELLAGGSAGRAMAQAAS